MGKVSDAPKITAFLHEYMLLGSFNYFSFVQQIIKGGGLYGMFVFIDLSRLGLSFRSRVRRLAWVCLSLSILRPNVMTFCSQCPLFLGQAIYVRGNYLILFLTP